MSRYFTRLSNTVSTGAGMTNFSRTGAGVLLATMPEAEPKGLPFASTPSNAGLTIAMIPPENASGQARC